MKQLKRHICDEQNELHYTLVGGYYIRPNKAEEIERSKTIYH